MTSSKFDLYVVRNFFDTQTCQRLIGEMRQSVSSSALTYGSSEYGLVDERVRKVGRVTPSTKTIDNVTRALIDRRDEISQHFGLDLSGCEEPQFLCYRVGDFFVAHQDGNTGLIQLESDRTRRISVSVFLNNQSSEPELETYSGGSLVFSDWRTGARQELVGEAGMLVAFRSETTHEITPVTHGERYAIVSWYGNSEQ